MPLVYSACVRIFMLYMRRINQMQASTDATSAIRYAHQIIFTFPDRESRYAAGSNTTSCRIKVAIML